MTVFGRLRMPPLGGAAEWLNSGPLRPAGLRGHVVLVDSWTLTCINWLRTELRRQGTETMQALIVGREITGLGA